MDLRTFIGMGKVKREPEVVEPKPVSTSPLVLDSAGMDLYLGRILGHDTVDLASNVEGFGLMPGSFEASKKELADELGFTYGVLGDNDSVRKTVDQLVAASIERQDLKEVIGAENKAAATLRVVTDLLQVDYPVEGRELKAAVQGASGINPLEYRRALGSIIVPTLSGPVGRQSLSLYDITNDLERRRVIETRRKEAKLARDTLELKGAGTRRRFLREELLERAKRAVPEYFFTAVDGVMAALDAKGFTSKKKNRQTEDGSTIFENNAAVYYTERMAARKAREYARAIGKEMQDGITLDKAEAAVELRYREQRRPISESVDARLEKALDALDQDTTTWIDQAYLPSIEGAREKLSEAVDAIHVADSNLRDKLADSVGRVSKPLELVVDVYAALLDEGKRRVDVLPFVEDLTMVVGKIGQGKEVFVDHAREVLSKEGLDAVLDFVSDTSYGVKLGGNPKDSVKYARTGMALEKQKGVKFRDSFDEAVEFGVNSGGSFDVSCGFAADYVSWVEGTKLDHGVAFRAVASAVENHGFGLEDVIGFVTEYDRRAADPNICDSFVSGALWTEYYRYTLDEGRNGVGKSTNSQLSALLADNALVRVKRVGFDTSAAHNFLNGCMLAAGGGVGSAKLITYFGDSYKTVVDKYGEDDARGVFTPAYLETVKRAKTVKGRDGSPRFSDDELAGLVTHGVQAVEFSRENPGYKLGDVVSNAFYAYASEVGVDVKERFEFGKRAVDVGKSGGNFKRWANATIGYAHSGFSLGGAMRLADALEGYAKAHDGAYRLDDVNSSLRVHTGPEDEKVAYAIERLRASNGVDTAAVNTTSTTASGGSDPSFSAAGAN